MIYDRSSALVHDAGLGVERRGGLIGLSLRLRETLSGGRHCRERRCTTRPTLTTGTVTAGSVLPRRSSAPLAWRSRSPSRYSRARFIRCWTSVPAKGAGNRLLHRLRPRARYAGVDSSRWAVANGARRRNLRLGSSTHSTSSASMGRLISSSPPISCITSPLPVLGPASRRSSPLLGGVAFLPTFTAADEIEGDRAQLPAA